jgi:hypothetical protein
MIIQPITTTVSLTNAYIPTPGNVSKLTIDEKINWLKQAIQIEKVSNDDSLTQATIVNSIQKVIEQLKIRANHIDPKLPQENTKSNALVLKSNTNASLPLGYNNILLNAKV